MKLWLFGTYKWQGNPKALFIYMNQHYSSTHELWWIADDEISAQKIKNLGYNATYLNSDLAKYLFENANVYVNENFRQAYPNIMNPNITILNLWHGVGIKHVELGLGMNSALNKDIMNKYLKNASLYTNNTLFLSTSKFMDEHFTKDTLITKERLVKGPYPRNIIYKDEDNRNIKNYNEISKIDNYNQVYLFAPTYRYKQINGIFSKLIPDVKSLQHILYKNNSCMIIKVHPFMTKDSEYQLLNENKELYPNIILWNDDFDIYEIFSKIDIGIIDYSSIFYDLLESGVNKYIRYIPDYEEYVQDSSLIDDYFLNTEGEISHSFEELLELIKKDTKMINDKNKLINKFFEYGKYYTVDDIIKQTDDFVPSNKKLPELHTFDIFDTLIRRKTIEPKSIFYKVQKDIINSSIKFPKYIQAEYPKIRHQVEMDLRDAYKKTLFERKTDKLEVTLQDVLERLQSSYDLTQKQVDFLYNSEVEIEISNMEPIRSKIQELFQLKNSGHKIILLSDMYLPKNVIEKILLNINTELNKFEKYISSDIGYQKSTGKLFEYIFFELSPYRYSKWVHHGDNNYADGNVPREYGINTIIHDMDTFIPFERYLIDKTPDSYKWDSYKLVSAMQRYRWDLLDSYNMVFDENLYYSFSYIGSAFVPYIYWVLQHALKHGYKDLYFISRDGYFLKKIADVLINKLKLPLNTKYIYGSRKAWRVASFINEIDEESFTPFGMFANIDTFEELILSSQLDKETLLKIVPEIKRFEDLELTENHKNEIRGILANSTEYKNALLKIAKEKRKIVNTYLKQSIDFSKSFAFVEFWGRGYTQDTLTRLLESAAERPILNPFYYIRNFTPNYGNSIRHRFTVKPSNYSYFESIFAQTPYESISGYEYGSSGEVKPIIKSQENEFHRAISKGIEDFASIYAELCNTFEEDFEKCISDISYTYQFSHPSDYYIANTFARYKDNLAMYGEVKEFAPEIFENDIKTIGIHNLNRITRNIEMSAARSSEKVRSYINKHLNKSYKAKKAPFIINDLSKYIKNIHYPTYLCNLKEQPIFENVNWSSNSKSKNKIYHGDIIKVYGIEWTYSGVPRLKVENGYVTASKEYITTISNLKEVYSVIKQPLYKRSDVKEQIGTVEPGELLKILDVIRSKIGKEILLTSKGYVPIENNNLIAKCLKSDQTTSFQSLDILKGKDIMFKTQVLGYDKLSKAEKTSYHFSSGNIFHVDDVVKSSEGKPYLYIKGKFVFSKIEDILILHNNYRQYIYNANDPYIELKQDVSVFNSVIFNENNKHPKQLKKFSTYKIEDIEWLDNGVPRLKIKHGYISANRKFIFSKNKPQKCKCLAKKLLNKFKIKYY